MRTHCLNSFLHGSHLTWVFLVKFAGKTNWHLLPLKFNVLLIVLVVVANLFSGLKIMTGHRTMSGQDDYLSGQNLGLAVILTGQVRGFQIIH